MASLVCGSWAMACWRVCGGVWAYTLAWPRVVWHDDVCLDGAGWGGWAVMHWKGEVPPSLQGPQPMPSHCPPDGKCQLQWHL